MPARRKTMPSKYVDNMGRKLTLGLFHEFRKPEQTCESFYSIIEAKAKYIELRDPTGYKFAIWLVNDYAHWLEIRENQTLKPIIEGWDAELDALLRCEAIEALKEHAKQPGGTAAAKWIAEHGYKAAEKIKSPVGRPRKVVEEEAPDVERLKGDMTRLGLVIGGKQ